MTTMPTAFRPDSSAMRSRTRLTQRLLDPLRQSAGQFATLALVGLVSLASPVSAAAAGDCPADLNGDGVVNGADLGILLSAWGSKGSAADLTGNGIVDGADLGALLGDWDATCSVLPWATVLEQEPDPKVVTNAELRAAIIATGLPWRVQDIGTGIEMLLVPPGTFMMGCSPSLQYACEPDENPVHEVTLTQPFFLGRYEVTQAEWVAVMGTNPSFFQSPSPEVPVAHIAARPVEQVSWSAIQFFTAETQLRLPSEAEWEYACRAGTTTAFNNGSNDDSTLDVLAWSIDNSSDQTRPTGMRIANALGFHDMHGNVAEWVEDWFGVDYYSTSPLVDPLGPISGVCRLLRGGHWSTVSAGCRSSFRYCELPDFTNSRLGFRVARTP